MFWNVGKFIAAAATNCITGLNVAAGCALGSLNLVSAFSATGSVTSALVTMSQLVDILHVYGYLNPRKTLNPEPCSLKPRP